MAEHATPYFLYILNSEFEKKKNKNDAYSVRAFAKFIQINPGVLNQIMNKKRTLSLDQAKKISEVLVLHETEKDLFLRSAFYSKKVLDDLQKERIDSNTMSLGCETTYNKVSTEWEHYAYVALMDVENYTNDHNWASVKLGVTKERLDTVVQNLLDTKVITLDNGNYICDCDKVSFDVSRDSIAFKDSQKENLQLALDRLYQYDQTKNHFSSMTLAIEPKNIHRAKILIDDFVTRITSLLEDGERKDVYKVCVQLFPASLTESELEDL